MDIHKMQRFGQRFVWAVCLLVLFVIAAAADFKLIQNIGQHLGIWPVIFVLTAAGAAVFVLFRPAGRSLLQRLAATWRTCSRWLCGKYLTVTFIIVGSSLLLRILWLLLFQVTQLDSDFGAYFARAASYAAGEYPVDDYSALFPHVFGFSYVLSGVLKLFGSAIVVAQSFNMALYLVSVLLLGLLIPPREHPGRFLFCVATVSWWPSLIYFTLFANTEYMFIVCWLLFLLLLKRLFQGTFAMALLHTGLLLLLVALSNFIRPVGSIVLVVFVLVLCLAPGVRSIRSIQDLAQRGAMLALGLAVYIGASAALNAFVSHHIHLQAASAPIGFNVFVGTNPHMQGEDLGLWNHADSMALSAAYEDAGDAQAAHNVMLRQGLERLQHWFASHQGAYFLAHKIKTAWGTDSWALQLVDAHLASHARHDFSHGLFRSVHVGLAALGDLVYAMFLTGAALVLLARLRRHRFSPPGLVPLAAALFLIGTFLLLLLVESAPRYHMPGFIALLLLLTAPGPDDSRPQE